jgi:hypothetical protein
MLSHVSITNRTQQSLCLHGCCVGGPPALGLLAVWSGCCGVELCFVADVGGKGGSYDVPSQSRLFTEPICQIYSSPVGVRHL